MQGSRAVSLATARWIVIAMYFAAVVVYPAIGAMVKTTQLVPDGTLRLLPTLFLVMAGVDYVISLVLEASLLTQARRERNPTGAVTAAILTGSFGCSFGVFGLILGLLGARAWSMPFYALSLVHGVHLMIRWPSLERVATGETCERES
jgi:hypothetical protein